MSNAVPPVICMVYIYEWAAPMAKMIESPDHAKEIVQHELVAVLEDPEQKVEIVKDVDNFMRQVNNHIEKTKVGRKNVVSFFKEVAKQSKAHRDAGNERAPNMQKIAEDICGEDHLGAINDIVGAVKRFVFGLDPMEIMLARLLGMVPDGDDEDDQDEE